jgi:signal transduction histidine kinase
MTSRNLLRAAGLLVWAFAGIPAALSIAEAPRMGLARLLVWLSAFAVFGVAFFRATRAEAPEGRSIARLLAVQTIAALTMNVALCTGFEVALGVIVAVELGLLLPLSLGLPWLGVQYAAAAALAVDHMGWSHGETWSIAVLGGEAFAFTVAAMAGREAAARRALERTNAELEATRDSLARASQAAERLRIARELHDLVGHDLVALHLELETARHLADPRTGERVGRAHEIAKGLLTDVRRAVSSLRTDDGPTDVAKDVRAILDHVSEPRVHLRMPAALGVDAERAHAVVRCIQEIVTNTRKHADATNLWITIAPHERGLELTARDDGCGGDLPSPGNGLAGMRERVERLGGELVLETTPGDGFQVRAMLPGPRDLGAS